MTPQQREAEREHARRWARRTGTLIAYYAIFLLVAVAVNWLLQFEGFRMLFAGVAAAAVFVFLVERHGKSRS